MIKIPYEIIPIIDENSFNQVYHNEPVRFYHHKNGMWFGRFDVYISALETRKNKGKIERLC